MHPSRATSPYKPAPPRPAIPLALWCAAPLWAVTAVLVFFGWDWPAPVHRLLAFGGLAGIACTGLPFLRGVRRPLCAGIAGVCLGCLLAGSQALQWAADVADAGADRVGMQRAITLTADPSVGDYGSSAQGRMRLDSGRTVSVRVNLPEGLTAHCWDRILVTDAAHQPAEKARAFYAQRGWAGSVSPSTAEIVHPDGVRGAIADLRRLTVERFLAPATPGAFLLAALVCGDRTALFQDTAYDDIVTAGLAHMVAVSGAHLAIVSGIVGVLLMHAHIPRIGRSACMVAFMIAYALFAGCPVSVLRATVMAALALCAAFAKRRRNTLSALALCIIVFLSLEPCLALSVSFSLSCLSMLGIALFYPLAQQWMAALCRGHASGLSESLALTLAASLLTVPVSAPLFAQLSIVAPLSNLLVAPVLGAACASGFAAAILMAILPASAPLLSWVCSLLGDGALSATHLLAALPGASVPVDVDLIPALALAALACVALYALWPAPTLATGLAGCLPLACAIVVGYAAGPFLHGTEIDMLDVGQGDAFVLRSGPRAVLIDTGTNDADLLKGLARHDVHALDAVVITHADDDHCGSLSALLRTIPVGAVIVAQDLPACTAQSCVKLMAQLQGQPIQRVAKGDRVRWGRFEATVVSPATYCDEGGNADSLVLLVSIDSNADGDYEVRGLFTGDAEAEVLAPLADEGSIPPIDILKVPHHGSKAGLTPELLKNLSPRIGLISVGEGNRYGHPKPETLHALEACGATVARTDQEGDVVCELKADRIVLAPSRVH